jgi:hypothetical protein
MITIPTSNGIALIDPNHILAVFPFRLGSFSTNSVRVMYPTTHIDLPVDCGIEAEKTIKLIRSHLEDLNQG